ncbi:MAG: fibronectin type III domain-containing protein [Verrucomicrobia bacterium]|nr:fibronectin type III domain-containing protein [Verrucomicrobiota bacterium]
MKTAPSILFTVAALCFGNSAYAQKGIPVPVDGFNQDLVADGEGDVNSSVTSGFDHEKNSAIAMVFYQKGYKNGKYGLPADGKIKSKMTPNVEYQLADYSKKNATLITENGANSTLRLKSAGSFDKITLLAASAGNPDRDASFRAELNFSDGSKASAEFTVPDWFSKNDAIAIQGVDRVRISDGNFENTSVNPKLFDCAIDLQPTDELKVLNSVTITKTGGTNRVSIFALCGVTAEGTPEAVSVKKPEEVSEGSAKLSWSPSKGATSYKLDLSKSADFEKMHGDYNNRDVRNRTELKIEGLRKATNYHYRVRPANKKGSGANSDVVSFKTGGNAETKPPLITYKVAAGKDTEGKDIKIYESKYVEFEISKGKRVSEGAAMFSDEEMKNYTQMFEVNDFKTLKDEYLEGDDGPIFEVSFRGKKVTFRENAAPDELLDISDAMDGLVFD